MQAYLLTCNGYKIVATVSAEENLPYLCGVWEKALNDGYAVVAEVNGCIVADATGLLDLSAVDKPDPFDVACERRFD